MLAHIVRMARYLLDLELESREGTKIAGSQAQDVWGMSTYFGSFKFQMTPTTPDVFWPFLALAITSRGQVGIPLDAFILLWIQELHSAHSCGMLGMLGMVIGKSSGCIRIGKSLQHRANKEDANSY